MAGMEAPAAVLQRLESLSSQHVSTYEDGGRIAWRTWGEGPALLLLHGGYGSWRHWVRNIDALSRHYRLLVPDLPGLGDSSSAPRDLDADEIAGLVLEGASQLTRPGTGFSVAGFSFGSIIAGHLAARTRVSSLILVSPSGLGAPRTNVPLEKVSADASDAERAATHRRNLESLMIADPRNVDDLAVAVQTINVNLARFKSIGFSKTDTLTTALRNSQAERISAIWGANDAVARGALNERVERLKAIPRFAGFDTIEGAGHWVMYEAAIQFNSIVLRSLDNALRP